MYFIFVIITLIVTHRNKNIYLFIIKIASILLFGLCCTALLIGNQVPSLSVRKFIPPHMIFHKNNLLLAHIYSKYKVKLSKNKLFIVKYIMLKLSYLLYRKMIPYNCRSSEWDITNINMNFKFAYFNDSTDISFNYYVTEEFDSNKTILSFLKPYIKNRALFDLSHLGEGFFNKINTCENKLTQEEEQIINSNIKKELSLELTEAIIESQNSDKNIQRIWQYLQYFYNIKNKLSILVRKLLGPMETQLLDNTIDMIHLQTNLNSYLKEFIKDDKYDSDQSQRILHKEILNCIYGILSYLAHLHTVHISFIYYWRKFQHLSENINKTSNNTELCLLFQYLINQIQKTYYEKTEILCSKIQHQTQGFDNTIFTYLINNYYINTNSCETNNKWAELRNITNAYDVEKNSLSKKSIQSCQIYMNEIKSLIAIMSIYTKFLDIYKNNQISFDEIKYILFYNSKYEHYLPIDKNTLKIKKELEILYENNYISLSESDFTKYKKNLEKKETNQEITQMNHVHARKDTIEEKYSLGEMFYNVDCDNMNSPIINYDTKPEQQKPQPQKHKQHSRLQKKTHKIEDKLHAPKNILEIQKKPDKKKITEDNVDCENMNSPIINYDTNPEQQIPKEKLKKDISTTEIIINMMILSLIVIIVYNYFIKSTNTIDEKNN